MPLFETITDLQAKPEAVRGGHYGVIETIGGRFVRLTLRPYPKVVTALGTRWIAGTLRRLRTGNRCRLYFNQPRSCPGFIALRYVETTSDADYATFRRALAVLDEVAELKNADALVCDAANPNLSDRLLSRLGWMPHAPMFGHRNFIKRLK